jgi:hypothetical protein
MAISLIADRMGNHTQQCLSHNYPRFDFSDWFQLVEAERDVLQDIRRYPSGCMDLIYAKSSCSDHVAAFKTSHRSEKFQRTDQKYFPVIVRCAGGTAG